MLNFPEFQAVPAPKASGESRKISLKEDSNKMLEVAAFRGTFHNNQRADGRGRQGTLALPVYATGTYHVPDFPEAAERERVRERESKRARTRERTEEDQRTTQGGIIELITTEGH